MSHMQEEYQIVQAESDRSAKSLFTPWGGMFIVCLFHGGVLGYYSNHTISLPIPLSLLLLQASPSGPPLSCSSILLG